MIVVTGCAGFIGSNLVDRLLGLGHVVLGIDNFSTGQLRFLDGALMNSSFKLCEADLSDIDLLKKLFSGAQMVYHFAANADVRFGTNHPRRDLEQNTIVTYNVLEAMRHNGVGRIAFSSTGSVYGESPQIPTPENGPFPVQTSLYGASKAAGEGLISAYCEGFGLQSWIFRFVSILGERYTHGHVFDFYQQLSTDPKVLKVLGNGKQRKSYLYVHDCIDAIFTAVEKSNEKVNIFNLGVDGYCEVNDSIAWITRKLDIKPELQYSGGERGWIGDNPFIYLDTSKIQSLGWRPKLSIQDGVLKTVEFLQKKSMGNGGTLKSPVVVITGASRWLGAQLAGAFWRCGWSLGLVSRDINALKRVSAVLDERVDQKIELFQSDLARQSEVEDLLQSIEGRFSSINALINNAAIHGPVGPLTANDLKMWKEAIQVDLLAPVALCKGLIPLIKKAGGGSIINIAGGGATGPRENFSAYATAKAGLVRFGETLAKELLSENIRVNSISPGAMKTSLLGEILECDPVLTGAREHQIASKVFEYGGASFESVANLAIFLSGDAGKNITGKIISAVWDNWSEWLSHLDELSNSDAYTLRRITGRDRGFAWGDND